MNASLMTSWQMGLVGRFGGVSHPPGGISKQSTRTYHRKSLSGTGDAAEAVSSWLSTGVEGRDTDRACTSGPAAEAAVGGAAGTSSPCCAVGSVGGGGDCLDVVGSPTRVGVDGAVAPAGAASVAVGTVEAEPGSEGEGRYGSIRLYESPNGKTVTGQHSVSLCTTHRPPAVA